MKFFVFGSTAYDLLLHYEGSFIEGIDPTNLQHLSVGYLAHTLDKHHGGTAANISWNLRLLGQEPLPVSAVGTDGGPYLALLRERGIATESIVEVKDASTAMAIIATDNSEHQITFFHPGADAKGAVPALDDVRDGVVYAVVSPRDCKAMLTAAQECKRFAIPFLFDPGQQSLNFTKDELRNAVSMSNGLVVNEYEWTLASEKLGWSQEEVIDVCGLLVITQAEKGISFHTKNEAVMIPACTPDRVANPVGAGDAVRAGLLIGLANSWSLTDTGRLCNALGSLVVEQPGAMLGSLDIDAFRARIFETYGQEVPGF